MTVKNIIRGFIFSAAVATAAVISTGCKFNGNLNSTAGGKPYELVVSVDDLLWNSSVADTLMSVFKAPVEMMNQNEPMFDMMRVKPEAVKDIILRHRNLLILQIDPSLSEPRSTAVIDPYASPQLLITLTAPTAAAMAEYLSENRLELQSLYNLQERNRAVAYNKKYGNPVLENEVEDMFGVKMNIPQTFIRKKNEGSSFLWFGQDYPIATQGVIMYSYPYSGQDDFTAENLLSRRNQFAAFIPGPRYPDVDSYMITSREFEPQVRYVKIGDRMWAEMRGLWDLHNDFMGGPFVSYSTLDPSSGKVLTIEGFVYSPKNPKRNMLRALEHLVYSIEFPTRTEIE